MSKCNSRTKLQKKNFYKNNKNKIKNKKNEDWYWQSKNKKDNYILGCQEREKREKNKNDSRWQFNYHPPPRTTPCGREHGCAYKETIKDQIWTYFSGSNIQKSMWKYQNTLLTMLITQILVWKYKYTIFFFFYLIQG